jgi:lipoprotein-releasing system permease protein
MYVLAMAFRLLRTRTMSYVAVAIIAAIVFLYLLIIAVLEGFKAHYMDKIQAVQAHMTVRIGHIGDGITRPEEWAAELEKVKGIRGVTVNLEVPSLVQFDRGRTIGQMRGIDLDRDLRHGRIREMLKPDTLTSFGEHPDQRGRKRQGCIVGGAWRRLFELRVGDLVTFCFTELEGDDTPRAVQFKIIGFFEGQSQYLENSAYVDRSFLARQVGIEGKAKTLSLWLEGDPDRPDLEEIREAVRARMEQLLRQDAPDPELYRNALVVDTWREKDNNFYHAVSRENAIMRFIMAIFLLFAGFIIALILGQLVAEKIRDIGTLRALGATPFGVLNCFLLQGLLIAGVGLAAGLPLAEVTVSNLNEIELFVAKALESLLGIPNFRVFPAQDFLLDRIPTNLRPLDVMLIVILTLTSGLLGALIPALRAARKNPVECLRHE